MNRKLWSVVAVVLLAAVIPRFQLGAEYAKRPAHLHGIRHFPLEADSSIGTTEKIWNFFSATAAMPTIKTVELKKANLISSPRS